MYPPYRPRGYRQGPEYQYARRPFGDKSQRFGTALRDRATGLLLPGEVNGKGAPMGQPMSREHDWGPYERAFPGLQPSEIHSQATAAATRPTGQLGQAARPTSQIIVRQPSAPVAVTGGGLAINPATGGFPPGPRDPYAAAAGNAVMPVSPGNVPANREYMTTAGPAMNVTDNGGAVRPVSTGDFAATMDASHPGFATMAPADRANVFRSMAGMLQQPVVNTVPDGSRAVTSQYGTASATFPKPSTWQYDVVRQYPNIGVPGTAENQQFVEAYKNHPEQDPIALAKGVADGIQRQPHVASTRAEPNMDANDAEAPGNRPTQPRPTPAPTAPAQASKTAGAPQFPIPNQRATPLPGVQPKDDQVPGGSTG